MASKRRSWGTVRMMRGKYQASYIGPDGVRYYAPHTYTAKMDAEGWLAAERRLVEHDEWISPDRRKRDLTAGHTTVRDYATTWIKQRQLAEKTRWLYEHLYESRIAPEFADSLVSEVDAAAVRTWWANLPDTPTSNRQAYKLLRAIFNTAAEDKLIPANPVRIAGAGKQGRRRELEVLTPEKLAELVADMPEKYQGAALVLAWCGLRFGELIELRRNSFKRVDGVPVTVLVRSSATRVGNKMVVGGPKSDAGVRDVSIPPHIGAALAEHLRLFVGRGPESYAFTNVSNSQRLTQRAFTLAFKRSAEKVGYKDLRVHDLRHVGATLAAQAGATTRELMERLGHTTPGVAMHYQHASADRDRQIAASLSALAGKPKR
ncbi:tyrosine-type recombinase/integrase [Gordonia sp. (in: high G+C Gram-positive bacteria)]|uniref:tyrosine-type recombinase/integrase n=1 Tax=Gordonia sp. (in: high G+C Gram-positive bacteria) TaxID=84139 RepID=UPI003C793120